MTSESAFQRGIDEYLAGRHYEAHEHWEELWQDEPDEELRQFLQALIQVASAVHKAVHDVAPRGSLRLLDAAAQKLSPLGETYWGLDLTRLREGIAACRDEVARQLEETGHCSLDASFVPALVQLTRGPDAPIPAKPTPAVPRHARSAWFDRGLATYAEGDFFEAHELWEELWRDAPRGFDRDFVQGLIQVAAAMHKWFEHGKPKPAARLLGRAIDKIAGAPTGYRGLDVAGLVRQARAAKTALENEGALARSDVPSIVRITH